MQLQKLLELEGLEKEEEGEIRKRLLDFIDWLAAQPNREYSFEDVQRRVGYDELDLFVQIYKYSLRKDNKLEIIETEMRGRPVLYFSAKEERAEDE